MAGDFKSHVHARLILPPGTLGPQQRHQLVLPVQVDDIRQALMEIRSRLIVTDDTASNLASAGLVVAPGGTVAAVGPSAQSSVTGRTLAGGVKILVSDGGPGNDVTIDALAHTHGSDGELGKLDAGAISDTMVFMAEYAEVAFS